MSTTAIIQNAGDVTDTPALPLGAWDLVSFLTNTTDYAGFVGGALVTLLGLIILIVAGVFVTKKLFGNGQQQEKSWIMIAVMILLGGAFFGGGLTLIQMVASGGEQTIKDLGGGFIVLSGYLGR